MVRVEELRGPGAREGGRVFAGAIADQPNGRREQLEGIGVRLVVQEGAAGHEAAVLSERYAGARRSGEAPVGGRSLSAEAAHLEPGGVVMGSGPEASRAREAGPNHLPEELALHGILSRCQREDGEPLDDGAERGDHARLAGVQIRVSGPFHGGSIGRNVLLPVVGPWEGDGARQGRYPVAMHLPGLAYSGPMDAIPWRETRYPGVFWHDLAPDAEGPARTVLVRMDPGCGYPRHRHLGPEDVLVLSGAYQDDDGRVLRAGDFVRYPAGREHAPRGLEGGDGGACLLMAVAHGGTEHVEPD